MGKLPGTGLLISWVRFLRPSGSSAVWGLFQTVPGKLVGLVSPEAPSVKLLKPSAWSSGDAFFSWRSLV